MKIRKTLLLAAFAVILPAASYASYCGILISSGNFHVVEEGQVYRSAELSKAGFEREIHAHHIRSVLNLRGPHPDDAWYQDELAAAHEHGAEHFDVGISARSAVPSDKIAKILAVLRDAPKPILIHCQSGADRTGFASALYRYAIQGRSAEIAEGELSLWFGHFPYLFSKSGAMDASAQAYFLTHEPSAANAQSLLLQ
jgi:protein tyrosine/serine phosphatase